MQTGTRGKVTIIIVNYNGKKFLEKCMEGIRRQTYRQLSVLIVDNGSKDGSATYLLQKYPNVGLITCEKNVGFAAGNNLGMRHALRQGTEFVLLLNADTMPDPCMVEKLVAAADNSTVTVPKIYSDKRLMKVWYAGGEMDYVNGKSYHCGTAGTATSREVGFACGCCMLIHRDVITENGMFDEKYFLYFEDTDLSMRWGKNGVKIKYIPEAKLWHKAGGSGGKNGELVKTYYMTRNRLYFIKKYQEEIQKSVHQIAFEILMENMWKERDGERRKYVWWGILDFYRNRMFEMRHE